jgi:hypothetical protein
MGAAAEIRDLAYARPTHEPLHWLLLLLADRVAIAGWLAQAAVTPGEQGLVLRHFARQARAYPREFMAIALLTAAVVVTWARRSR